MTSIFSLFKQVLDNSKSILDEQRVAHEEELDDCWQDENRSSSCRLGLLKLQNKRNFRMITGSILTYKNYLLSLINVTSSNAILSLKLSIINKVSSVLLNTSIWCFAKLRLAFRFLMLLSLCSRIALYFLSFIFLFNQ